MRQFTAADPPRTKIDPFLPFLLGSSTNTSPLYVRVPFKAMGAADKRCKAVVRGPSWLDEDCHTATRKMKRDLQHAQRAAPQRHEISQSENSATLGKSMENKSTLYIL